MSLSGIRQHQMTEEGGMNAGSILWRYERRCFYGQTLSDMDEYLNEISQSISSIHIVMGSLVEVPAVWGLYSQAMSK